MALLTNQSDSNPLLISDSDRCKGLYILGLPRMGKSTLAVTLALKDIERGHGIFFLDPHGDAIDDIITNCSGASLRTRHYLLLDPTNNDSAFGINPLQCGDIDNPKERNATFARTKAIFDKLWKKTFEEKPWLQLILQNSLYALIENQGYTLAELPLFFTDVSFRNHICKNIKYNLTVKNYWLTGFASKSRQTQEEQMEAAQTRAEILLAHPYVYHVLAKAETTFDFSAIIEQRKIVLVRLSSSLSYETRKIIGTVLISELLHAIELRKTRDQLCIFIDEFQTFAAYEDMPMFITQAPKYGIATTLIHHERFGQLLDDPLLMGATGAIANKVLFQTTAKDAAEFAPEYAGKPPTTKRREQELVISQEPVDYLLSRGHANHDICDFANRVIRPMKEALSDTRDEMEGERLIRMDLLDEVALARLDERIDWLGESRGRYSSTILGKAMADVAAARQGTGRMQELLASTQSLKRILRAIDRALSALMQGKTGQGKEDFSQFLIGLAREFNRVPSGINKVLELYIAVYYGDIALPRAIPFDLSDRQNIFANERRAIRQALKEREEKERSELATSYPKKEWDEFHRRRQSQREEEDGERIVVTRLIREEILRELERGWYDPDKLYTNFVLLVSLPRVRKFVARYYDRGFGWPWKKTTGAKDEETRIANAIARIGFYVNGEDTPPVWFRKDVLRDLYKFVRRYKGGGFLALDLIDAAQAEWSSKGKRPTEEDIDEGLRRITGNKEEPLNVWNAASFMHRDYGQRFGVNYENFCMTDFRTICGTGVFTPIEYLHVVKALNDVLLSLKVDKRQLESAYCDGLHGAIRIRAFSLKLRETRRDAKECEALLEKNWEWFARQRPAESKVWRNTDELTKEYLLGRVCDLIRYGRAVADLTFPEPKENKYERTVSSLVWFVKEVNEQNEEAEARTRIEKECEGVLIKVSHAPQASVIDRPLTSEERNAVLAACEKEIDGSDKGRNMLAVVRQFGLFCGLLAKPENHIRVPGGQYIEVETPLRTEADMAGEIVRELTRLPEYTAYASIMQNGHKWRGRIKTSPLPDRVDDEESRIRQEYVSSMSLSCLTSRRDIMEEVELRQQSWRKDTEPPPVHS